MGVGKEFIDPNHDAQYVEKRGRIVTVADLEPLDNAFIHDRKPPRFPEGYICLKTGIGDQSQPQKQGNQQSHPKPLRKLHENYCSRNRESIDTQNYLTRDKKARIIQYNSIDRRCLWQIIC